MRSFSHIGIIIIFVTYNHSLWLGVQAPTAEVQAVLEVHSEVDEGMHQIHTLQL